MSLDVDSLERLIPECVQSGDSTGQETLDLHIARYEFAAQQAKPGRLLDMACGAGYGTKLLCDRLSPNAIITGVDISEDAVKYAQANYGDSRIQFKVSNAMTFSDPEGFDTIVSLETIEHLQDPRGFVAHLVNLLEPGGILIGSVPTTPSVDANPHHLHDFTLKTFQELFHVHQLIEVGRFEQCQPFKPFALLTKREVRAKDIRPNLPKYYLQHPGALVRRIASTLCHGFTNQYITVAWQKPLQFTV